MANHKSTILTYEVALMTASGIVSIKETTPFGFIPMAEIPIPVLPEENISARVQSLADSVYGLDELAYYLDTPDTDVTPTHLRKQAYELLAKTIQFIHLLPEE